MPSVFFETFGCQMNVADSNMLAQALYAKGYYAADDCASADLIVVNTCSVREHAEVRAKARIVEYVNKKKKSAHPPEIWVIGCMAQRLGAFLHNEIRGIDKIVGAKEIVSFTQGLCGPMHNDEAAIHGERKATGRISAFVPIMRGCNNFCSYCIVPYVRGKETSIPAVEIEKDIISLVENGTKEVTLLGQNVNSYNDGTLDFSGLLKKIHSVQGLLRIRFTTSHPKDCTDALLDTVAQRPKLCRHIHLPVQSGSTRILDLMNRKYTRETYLQRIEAIKDKIPYADISTDVMVGFPGETDKDFEETMSLFDQVRFTSAFMFAYSGREGTEAAKMDDDVPVSIKKERLNRLISLQTAITKERYAEMVGKNMDVLFLERQRGRQKLWIGQDNGCKRALLACNDSVAGMILQVRAIHSSGMTLVTERI
jgi:tRNA-2-methylthio-N6-dimethylallyladenosine synthase